MYNRSTNDPSIVDGCTWDFGDGQVVQNQACLPGEYIVHIFPTYPTPIDAPAECRRYLVYLTIHFNNGYPDEVSNHYVANIPYGTEGNALCTGQWH